MHADASTVEVRVLFAAREPALSWNHTNLSAPYWRFYWNASGAASVVLRGRRSELAPRTGYLIPPNTDFDSHSPATIDHLYIHFVLDQWTLVEPGLYQADALSELAPLVASLAESLPARSEPPTPPAGRTLTRAAALALLAVASLPEQVVTPGHLHPSVARAIREIDANLAAPLPAPELAARSGCGERTLRRRFLESTGLTPGAYAQNRRIEQACILLHFSDASVDEIATRTGFCDRYHFTRAFSRARGMGPASFRKMVVAV